MQAFVEEMNRRTAEALGGREVSAFEVGAPVEQTLDGAPPLLAKAGGDGPGHATQGRGRALMSTETIELPRTGEPGAGGGAAGA